MDTFIVVTDGCGVAALRLFVSMRPVDTISSRELIIFIFSLNVIITQKVTLSSATQHTMSGRKMGSGMSYH